MWDPSADFETKTLSNGLTIYAAHWPNRPWQIVRFVIHSGGVHDPVGLEGLAHYVEHLISRNANLPKNDLKEFFESRGGSVNLGETSYNNTQYGFKLPADESMLKKAFSLAGNALLGAQLRKCIEHERKIIIGEYRRKFPQLFKKTLLERKLTNLYLGCWPEDNLSLLGTPETISTITQTNLQSFYDAHYTPANMSIVSVGGLETGDLLDLIEQSSLSQEKQGARSKPIQPAIHSPRPKENIYAVQTSELGASWEADGCGSFTVIPGVYQEYAVRILRNMLYDTLFKEFRDHQALTYSVGVTWRRTPHFYEVSMECGHLPKNTARRASSILADCINSLHDNDYLLTRIQNKMLVRCPMIDLNGEDTCSSAADYLAAEGRIVSLLEEIERIERVSMQTIQSILKWFRPERRWTILFHS